MERMKDTLLDRVVEALPANAALRYELGRAELAQSVLAALGLDDFKAAVERGAKALGWDEEMDHEPHGEQLWDEAQEVLEAALLATEEGE